MEICEKQQVLRRLKGYVGVSFNPQSQYFYVYYMEYGHSSDSCQGLRREIERVKREYPHLQ